MHEIVHIAFALFLLKVFGNPIFVFPLAFVSHFVLDIVPHYKLKHPTRKSFVIEMVIDVLISAVFVALYLIYASDAPGTLMVLATCFFATLPDFFLLLRFLWKIEIFKPLMISFHARIQHEYQWAWIIELGFLFCLLFFLF